MKRIITVSREFGSGGRTIAKELAERLNIKYYDKELVEKVAVRTGLDKDFIEERGEYAAAKSRFGMLFSQVGIPGVMNGLSAESFLWCIQREVILKIADEEPCVIVGRCADYILSERKDVLNVFIHAPTGFRAAHIVEHYGTSDKAPEERLKDKDTRRRLYYKEFTNREWGMSQNYDISLNSAALGIERCVSIIADAFTAE